MINSVFENGIQFLDSILPTQYQNGIVPLLIINLCITFGAISVMKLIFYILRNVKDTKRREKRFVVIIGVLLLLFVSQIPARRKLEPYEYLIIYSILIGLFFLIYKLRDIFEKLGIPIDLDGDLKMKEEPRYKDYSILACPNCRKRTISWMHVIKEAQTCGACGKRYKGVIPVKTDRAFLALSIITFCVGGYLLTCPCISKVLSILVALSGFVIYIIYRLRPKELVEVDNV